MIFTQRTRTGSRAEMSIKKIALRIKVLIVALTVGAAACAQIGTQEKERFRDEAIDLAKLGHAARERQDIPAAEEYFKKALAINKRIGRIEGMANNYRNLGTLATQRKDPEGLSAVESEAADLKGVKDAEAYYKKALACDKKLGRPEGMAGNYRNLAILAEVRGDKSKARKLYTRSLELYRQAGLKEEEIADVKGMLDALDPAK